MAVNLAKVGHIWYRVYDRNGGDVRVSKHRVTRVTPAGVWVEPGWDTEQKFVLIHANKRWACPTMKEALESFIARKKRQTLLLTKQLKNIETALKLAQEGLAKGEMPPYYQVRHAFFNWDEFA